MSFSEEWLSVSPADEPFLASFAPVLPVLLLVFSVLLSVLPVLPLFEVELVPEAMLPDFPLPCSTDVVLDTPELDLELLPPQAKRLKDKLVHRIIANFFFMLVSLSGIKLKCGLYLNSRT